MRDKDRQAQRTASDDMTERKNQRDRAQNEVTDQEAPASDADAVKGGLMPIRRGQDA